MSRWQVPLCGARCVKYGGILGFTIPDKVYLNFDTVNVHSMHRFMGLTRTGDPRKLLLDPTVAISADMFAVPKDIRDWYDATDWQILEVEEDESRRRTQSVMTAAQMMGVANGGQQATASGAYSLPLSFD